jgi:hypothetical protein
MTLSDPKDRKLCDVSLYLWNYDQSLTEHSLGCTVRFLIILSEILHCGSHLLTRGLVTLSQGQCGSNLGRYTLSTNESFIL